MSEINGPTMATGSRPDELTALRSEVQELRKEVRMLMAIVRQASTRIMHVVELQTPKGAEALSKALEDRDAYRLAFQDLHAQLHPIDPEDFAPEKLVPAPEGTPDLFEEVLTRMENRKL